MRSRTHDRFQNVADKREDFFLDDWCAHRKKSSILKGKCGLNTEGELTEKRGVLLWQFPFD